MLTPEHQLALDQLHKIEIKDSNALEVLAHRIDANRLIVTIAVYCGSLKRTDDGFPFRTRERFFILIDDNFPFSPPKIYSSHSRFAGRPHIQWKKSICMYVASDIEWNPSDGMYGFVTRLDEWLRRAAVNELDETGAALHPPVAYTSVNSKTIIPKANTPIISKNDWLGFASLIKTNETAYSIVEWLEPYSSLDNIDVAAVVLLKTAMPFEFPTKIYELLKELMDRGIKLSLILSILRAAAVKKNKDTPLLLIVGSPSRGIRGSDNVLQHLTAWEFDHDAELNVILSIGKQFSDPKWQKIGDKAQKDFIEWASKASVNWCIVQELRPEIVKRRDFSAELSIFQNKRVMVWGCGALGANVAISLARAGVKKLTLFDNKKVTPGVLLRQPYVQMDIGRPKVEALKDRIFQIEPDIDVEPHDENLHVVLKNEDLSKQEYDIIIDCTASNSIHYRIESIKKKNNPKAPIVSMIVSGKAREGLLIAIQKEYSGSVFDVYHKAMISVSQDLNAKKYADAFIPAKGEDSFFQPEPGCSDPTFVGSVSDILILANKMLNESTHIFRLNQNKATATFISTRETSDIKYKKYTSHSDQVLIDQKESYEIRITPSAHNEINTVISESARKRGADYETGGLLFGKRDDILKIIWVDEACGPPPDSTYFKDQFICGIQGVEQIANHKKIRSRGNISYVGVWHIHPNSEPFPSEMDLNGMFQILHEPYTNKTKNLLLIIKPGSVESKTATFVFDKDDFKENAMLTFDTRKTFNIVNRKEQNFSIGLALSGGGSRAIAFHLGCLRALNDRGTLKDITHLSTVSGGSVIGAMYAYHTGSFEKFDAEVTSLLKDGLISDIIGEIFSSGDFLAEIYNYIIQMPISSLSGIFPINPRLRRKRSRTTSFANVLNKKLYHDAKINKPPTDLDLIINATELSTGTAFRFNNIESGGWRFGKLLNNNVRLADAVAASAAYPALLPALDVDYDFIQGTSEKRKRVILTDGGVYDNLGVSAFKPKRKSAYGSKSRNPDYTICCNAGYGMFSGDNYPFSFISRMTQTVVSALRKIQDASMNKLHTYAETNQIEGFVLSYLGQIDKNLPYYWPDLVKREAVDYPTNFNPMSEENIVMLSNRGEQLTRLLIDYYHPNL
ncbi:ThiF family adenylyltransferase [bacterium]|nr:ThiF family adenylyltransferase [bacterium]